MQEQERILCKCRVCNKLVYRLPKAAIKFRFCSNKCKWNRLKDKTNVRKTPKSNLVFKKCENELCDKGKLLRPFEVKRNKFKYCSHKCQRFVKSNKYKESLETKKEKNIERQKQHIWLL